MRFSPGLRPRGGGRARRADLADAMGGDVLLPSLVSGPLPHAAALVPSHVLDEDERWNAAGDGGDYPTAALIAHQQLKCPHLSPPVCGQRIMRTPRARAG